MSVIFLEVEMVVKGTAPDGAQVIVPIPTDGLTGPDGAALTLAAGGTDAFGQRIRTAHARAAAMLAAVP